MQRRYNFARLILASILVLVLTSLMVCVDAQARIAFESDRDGHIINNSWAYEIYVMDNDGGNQRNLTKNPADDRSPSWSPDGKRIVFMSNRDGHAKHGWLTSEIYVMDADGGINKDSPIMTVLTRPPHGLLTANELPSWGTGQST